MQKQVLRDVYDEGLTVEVEAEIDYDGVFVKGKDWQVIVENRSGKIAVVIWNRDDANDPDLLVNVPGGGEFTRMKELTL